jgi:hypothetical protein
MRSCQLTSNIHENKVFSRNVGMISAWSCRARQALRKKIFGSFPACGYGPRETFQTNSNLILHLSSCWNLQRKKCLPNRLLDRNFDLIIVLDCLRAQEFMVQLAHLFPTIFFVVARLVKTGLAVPPFCFNLKRYRWVIYAHWLGGCRCSKQRHIRSTSYLVLS